MQEKKIKINIFTALGQLFQASASTLKDIFDIALLEAQLASKSIPIIVVLLFCVGLFFITAWFAVVAILTLCLVSFGLTWKLSLLSIVGLSLLLIITSVLLILRYLHNMTFRHTRKHLEQTFQGSSRASPMSSRAKRGNS